MKNKTFYYVFIYIIKGEKETFRAICTGVSKNSNLLSSINNLQNNFMNGKIITIQQCDNLKEAEEMTNMYNESYKKQNKLFEF